MKKNCLITIILSVCLLISSLSFSGVALNIHHNIKTSEENLPTPENIKYPQFYDDYLSLVVDKLKNNPSFPPYDYPPGMYFFGDWEDETDEKVDVNIEGTGQLSYYPEDKYLLLKVTEGGTVNIDDFSEEYSSYEFLVILALYGFDGEYSDDENYFTVDGHVDYAFLMEMSRLFFIFHESEHLIRGTYWVGETITLNLANTHPKGEELKVENPHFYACDYYYEILLDEEFEKTWAIPTPGYYLQGVWSWDQKDRDGNQVPPMRLRDARHPYWIFMSCTIDGKTHVMFNSVDIYGFKSKEKASTNLFSNLLFLKTPLFRKFLNCEKPLLYSIYNGLLNLQ
jgi:hypothetical protein